MLWIFGVVRIPAGAGGDKALTLRLAEVATCIMPDSHK
jgi:hypothetical protein